MNSAGLPLKKPINMITPPLEDPSSSAHQPPQQVSGDPSESHRSWLKIIVTIVVVAGIVGGVAIFNGFIPWRTDTAADNNTPKYQCPMHPTVVSDRPGTCPICSMDLVPISADGGKSGPDAPVSGVPGLAVVSIPPQTRQLMGLKLGKVEQRSLSREVRTSARIVADETRLWRVTTKIEGWVDKLFVAYTGQEVKKGDPMLTIYSPMLVTAQAEYLTALRAQGGFKPGSEADATSGSTTLVASARRRLELWDISAEQIEQIERSGKVEKYLTLYAPANGVVTDRNITAGQKIMSGDPLLLIADLSVVWGDVDVYQSDLPYVKVGMPLEMSLPYWPGKVFTGKVSFVSPTLDADTRALRARLEIPNPERLLKPGMYGDARLFYELGEKLSIPAAAVMFGGQRTYAFRSKSDGHLIPVEIKLGARSDGHYELLGGLNEADTVVTSANFLVDSESNLKAALEAMVGGDSAEGSGPAQASEKIEVGTLSKLLPSYLEIQKALAADDLPAAIQASKGLADLKFKALDTISTAADLEQARKGFHALSASVLAALDKAGPPAGQKLYRFYCSMALDDQGGEWLQLDEAVRNPYFGATMLKCGEVKGPITAAKTSTTPAADPHAGHAR